MREFLFGAAEWWAGTAAGGGLVLLAGYALMRSARHPAARQRLGELAVMAALLVAVLRLLPSWVPLPWSAAPASAAVDAVAALPPVAPCTGGVWVDVPAEVAGL